MEKQKDILKETNTPLFKTFKRTASYAKKEIISFIIAFARLYPGADFAPKMKVVGAKSGSEPSFIL